MGSGRDRLGKLPSTVPTTITVWNSRPDGTVGGQDLHGVGVPAFPRREAGSSFARVHRCEERLDRGIGGRPRFRDRAREGDDGIELAPRLDGCVASFDEAARARELTPQGGERIEHRTVRILRRAIENPSYLLHLRGLLGGQAVGELEGPRHRPRPWCARPAGGRAPPPARAARGPRSRRTRSVRSVRPPIPRASATPARTDAWRALGRGTRRSREPSWARERRPGHGAALRRAHPVDGRPPPGPPIATPSSTWSRRSSRAMAAYSSDV